MAKGGYVVDMQNLDITHFKAVVFDWDNTLAQSTPPLTYAVNRVLKTYHLPCWNIIKQKRDTNLSFRDNFPILFGKDANAAYSQYKHIYLQAVGKMISRTPYASEVLHFFKKRYIPIFLMTSKDRELLEFELPMLFEPEYFDCIVCGHEAEKDKPHGDHLMYTLNHCASNKPLCPKDVLVVGDSPQDSACAVSCGATAVIIGRDVTSEQSSNDANIMYFDSFVDFYQSLLLS